MASSIFDTMMNGQELTPLTPELRRQVRVVRPGQSVLFQDPAPAPLPMQVPTVQPSMPIFSQMQPQLQRQAQARIAPNKPVSATAMGETAQPLSPLQLKGEEAKQRASFFSSISKVLADPNAQQFLGQLGIAFAGGRPDQPGTILGQAAIQAAQSQMEAGIISGLLAGDPSALARYPLASSETRARAQEAVMQKERLDLAKKEAGLRERETVVSEQDLQRRVADTESTIAAREKGLEIDLARLGFEGLKLNLAADAQEFNQQIAEAEVRIAQSRAAAQNTLDQAQARYYEGKATGDVEASTGALQSMAVLYRETSDQWNKLDEEIRKLDARVLDTKNYTQAQRDQAKAAADRLRAQQEQLKTVNQSAYDRILNINNPQPGSSQSNPIDIQSEADAEKYPAGTYVRLNGRIARVQ